MHNPRCNCQSKIFFTWHSPTEVVDQWKLVSAWHRWVLTWSLSHPSMLAHVGIVGLIILDRWQNVIADVVLYPYSFHAIYSMNRIVDKWVFHFFTQSVHLFLQKLTVRKNFSGVTNEWILFALELNKIPKKAVKECPQVNRVYVSEL
jgi:hypothetical protein